MCEKHDRICPGYRNIVDLMFRDESEHVIRKAHKTRSKKATKPKDGETRRAAKRMTRAPSTSSSAPSPLESQQGRSPEGTVQPGPRSGAASHSPENPDPVSRARPTSKRSPPSYVAVEPPNEGFRTLALMTPLNTTMVTTNMGVNAKAYFDRHDKGDEEMSLLPSPGEGTWPSTPFATLAYTLPPSFQEQGMAFFFSRYVTVEENTGHQNYQFVYEIWKPASLLPERQIDGVLASMTAVGLADMSSLTKCPERLDWARRSYGTALRLTNDAIMNPTEALKDSTLLSVLILGTYEMLAGPSPETMRAWQEHMNGAAALAKLRGTKQFQSKAGIRMFLMLCQTITISCIHQNLPMPAGLIKLRNDLEKTLTPVDPTWAMAEPIYKILQVRYDIKCGLISETESIVDQLVTIDNEYAQLIDDLPDSWQYKVVRLAKANSVAFSSECHVYPSIENATTWNGLRSLRMLVHETILGELFKRLQGRFPHEISPEHKLQFARSHRLLEQLRDATLASIPQHFGVVSFRGAKTAYQATKSDLCPPISMVIAQDSPYQVLSTPPAHASISPKMRAQLVAADSDNPTVMDFVAPSKASDDGDARFMTLASSRHAIVYPLYLLGVSSCCTPEVKAYVVERLRAIYAESGMVQAMTVAEMVRAKDTRSPWEGFVLSGIPDDSAEPVPTRI